MERGLRERAARRASWAWGQWFRRREGSQPRRQGAGTERTTNMFVVSGSLDMSKYSGWLNADAPCRVKRESTEG